MRIKVVVLSLLIISLSIVSTTFVLLTLTSKNWSTQSYYTSQNAQKWTQSVCTAGRSPFYKCSVPKLATDGTTGKPSCSFSSCKYYKPFGFDQTSCRLPVEIGTTISQLFIDNSQECQQGEHPTPPPHLSIFLYTDKADVERLHLKQFTMQETSKSRLRASSPLL